jgi:FAD/FMN-containing dehydrogenase
MTLLGLAAVVLLASTQAAASTTCSLMQTLYSAIAIDLPQSQNFNTQQTLYWSTACGGLIPTCIINPKSTAEVVTIVKALLTNNETFAIKSGGHNPNNYFASVDGGPLISTENLNEVTLDKVAETVRVGPGNRWDTVSAALDGTGYSAVGGRIGNVGVGGYMLGGKITPSRASYKWL